ncbi:TetR/AcrR family transcriptional regulator [Embleya hyalina]|uniref:TetR family transcriptional regulator n=1 Tax=Embleya hyalina TaxID=516124 RepID=A0A401YUA5_9ACTN|nr:TetR/AcrR family transcriptional regulator C-terminal domain-containing protein [Embleya hyalina]GCD98125.1 TetR family transcriptional regulator [Embleya hyalina]
MPAPRKFSREQLRAAALTLVDAHGLAALTMRSLAATLGTGAMTIYNYVDGREGLEGLLVEAVLADALPATEPGAEADDWRSEVRRLAEANWRAVRAHPDVIPLILTRRITDEATLVHGEALLRALARSGRRGVELLYAFRTVTGFVTGFAQAELAGPLSIAPDEDVRSITDRARALPADRFPYLIEIAGAAAESSPSDEFRAGLDLLLAGLERRPAGPDGGRRDPAVA